MCDAVNHFVHETILPMAREALEGVQYAHEKAVEGAQWLGRKIHDLTHSVLPRPVAIIAEAALKSLPFIAASLLLPFPAFLGLVGAVVVYKMITAPKNQPNIPTSLINGVGFSCLWTGCRIITLGLTGAGPVAIVAGVFNIVSASICLSNSGLLKELFRNPEAV